MKGMSLLKSFYGSPLSEGLSTSCFLRLARHYGICPRAIFPHYVNPQLSPPAPPNFPSVPPTRQVLSCYQNFGFTVLSLPDYALTLLAGSLFRVSAQTPARVARAPSHLPLSPRSTPYISFSICAEGITKIIKNQN